MNLSDWGLSAGEYGYRRLLHDCAENLNFRHMCSKDLDGRWYCEGCRTCAPEEIQFIADLAPARSAKEPWARIPGWAVDRSNRGNRLYEPK